MSYLNSRGKILKHHPEMRMMALPMQALLAAQFLSALADNILLIAAIALVKLVGQTGQISWVQSGFLLPYVLLAPWAGTLADALPKGKVLLLGNGIKLAGVLMMMSGMSPVLAYLVAGMGATLYSPAKYGILSQFFPVDRLVRANALLEGSTIVAILLGVVAGGWLADQSPLLAMQVTAAAYGFAMLINFLIPRLQPSVQDALRWHEWRVLARFGTYLHRLWRDPAARVSMLGTSLFWGCGATLRLMLFVWVPLALHRMDNQTPANLMGALSVGIVAGSALAWRYIHLDRIERAFAAGLVIGPCIMLLAAQHSLPATYGLMFILGMAGGAFVVPLNAWLQERGQAGIGAGQALSIQNLFENAAMLLLVSGWGLVSHMPVGHVIPAFGVLMLMGVAVLAVVARKSLPAG